MSKATSDRNLTKLKVTLTAGGLMATVIAAGLLGKEANAQTTVSSPDTNIEPALTTNSQRSSSFDTSIPEGLDLDLEAIPTVVAPTFNNSARAGVGRLRVNRVNPQSIPDQWYQRPFRAMGCRMSVWLDMEDSKTADRLLREAEDMFHAAERVLSRFDSTSELSRLNNRSGHWTLVSDLLWSVLTQALFMARETDGLFDPTQLAALETAGYDRSFTEMSPDQNMPDDIMIVDRWNQWQQVQLDRSAQAVWLPPGVRLDFGGIAKGHTAQRVVDFLSTEGPCLVDASGDLTAGEAPRDWPGWPVAVNAPFQETGATNDELFPLWLVNGTMATSGTDYRRWQRNGNLAHHVIDPRTSLPSETDLLTATVLARAAVRAETWATATLVAGSTGALEALTGMGLAAALVDQRGGLMLTPALEPYIAATV